MSFKTVTRNPHDIGRKIFCSSWPKMVVVLNGTLIDPAKFLEAKGSHYGMSPNGYVRVITETNGQPALVRDPRAPEQVIAVNTKTVYGHVALISHQSNVCGMCQELLRWADWWKPEVHTVDPPEVKTYTDKQLEDMKDERIRLYNSWVAGYKMRAGKSPPMDPQILQTSKPDRTLPVIPSTKVKNPQQVRTTTIKSG